MSRAEDKLAEHKKVCKQCAETDCLLKMCNTGKILTRVVFSEKNLR